MANKIDFFGKIYKTGADALRLIELPSARKAAKRMLDRKAQALDDAREDAETALNKLYAQFVSTDDKDKREAVFKDIVKQEIAVQEAERIASIAAKVKAKLFEAEVEE